MSSMPREALKTSASKPGVIVVPSSSAQGLGARDHFLRIGDIGRRDLVHHVGGGVAQHPLGADVEDLDDTLLVGGDAREVGAVEDRVLQGARLQQRLLHEFAGGSQVPTVRPWPSGRYCVCAKGDMRQSALAYSGGAMTTWMKSPGARPAVPAGVSAAAQVPGRQVCRHGGPDVRGNRGPDRDPAAGCGAHWRRGGGRTATRKDSAVAPVSFLDHRQPDRQSQPLGADRRLRPHIGLIREGGHMVDNSDRSHRADSAGRHSGVAAQPQVGLRSERRPRPRPVDPRHPAAQRTAVGSAAVRAARS